MKGKVEEPCATTTSMMKNSSSMLRWLLFGLKTVGTGLIVVYVFIPGIVWLNPWIQSKVIFLNMIRWPPMINLSEPKEFGLNGTRHMNLTHGGHSLGVWHVLPKSIHSSQQPLDEGLYEKSLSSGKPIVLYLHGNTGTRGGWHRVQLYKLLSEMDYHVVTFDYRGFGDSSGSPSEDGVCEDSIFIYNWIKQRQGSSPIFIWGHSLGTGVTTKVTKLLCEKNELPVGVILEAPFNNIREAAMLHPMAMPYKYFPWFANVFLDTIHHNNIHFASDKNIVDMKSPLLILHAHDDGIVPFELGKKLYDSAKTYHNGGADSVTFVEFLHHHGYGHKHIFKAPELPDIIKKFIKDSIKVRQDL